MKVISFSTPYFCLIASVIFTRRSDGKHYKDAVSSFENEVDSTKELLKENFPTHHEHPSKPHKVWKKEKEQGEFESYHEVEMTKNDAGKTKTKPTSEKTRFDSELSDKKFPEDFLFGIATASYQIEGAWNEGGKSENIWDHACHQIPSPILNNDTGDVACDSYHRYKEDVALLKNLGVDVYRFSISWSRILPNGFDNEINQDGIEYYKNLIRELKTNGIKPFVTLYHWDLPQKLQDLGGWQNDIIVDIFVDYARICFTEFGEDVKYWLTFNEPQQICNSGYGTAMLAPMIESPGVGEYLCSYNLLRAHSKVWHLYNNQFRKDQGGQVGITINGVWYEPASNSSKDMEASEIMLQFTYGMFANPLIHGDWPLSMKEIIARRSKLQGYKKSRLPEFTQEEIEFMKGTLDFLGLNLYTSNLAAAPIEADKPALTAEGLIADSGVVTWQPSEWEGSASYWLKITPWGMRKMLNWIENTYDNINIFITENGYSDHGELNDETRIRYYQSYLSSARDAMVKDDVNLLGYMAWSLLDNFEWIFGYTQKFGLHYVDFTDPNRTRIPKKSAIWYAKLCRTKCIVDVCTT